MFEKGRWWVGARRMDAGARGAVAIIIVVIVVISRRPATALQRHPSGSLDARGNQCKVPCLGSSLVGGNSGLPACLDGRDVGWLALESEEVDSIHAVVYGAPSPTAVPDCPVPQLWLMRHRRAVPGVCIYPSCKSSLFSKCHFLTFC